jgi:hypothetical protein
MVRKQGSRCGGVRTIYTVPFSLTYSIYKTFYSMQFVSAFIQGFVIFDFCTCDAFDSLV